MSLLTGVASNHFKTQFYDADDSIIMAWKFRYMLKIFRHEAMRHFGTVGMMQIYFAKLMEADEARLEQQGIDRAMFEVIDNGDGAKFSIIKDSINVNQMEVNQ